MTTQTSASVTPDSLPLSKRSEAKLRVLVLTNLFPNPLQPGRGIFTYNQLQALTASCDVRVIAPVLWTDEVNALVRRFRFMPSGRQSNQNGIAAEHPTYWYPPKLFRSFYGNCFYHSVKRAFRRVVAEFKPDVIYSPWAYPDGWAATKLAKAAGKPVALNILGSDLMLLEQFPARARSTQVALQSADQIITVSQGLSRRVVAMGVAPSRVSVVYNGVNREMFAPGDKGEVRAKLGLRPSATHLIGVGNLVSVKGFDLLLDACATLTNSPLDWELHLLGDGKLEAQLRQQAKQLGIADKVHFRGRVPQNVLADWMRAADLLVLSSRSEGIPNVLMEALSSELPYVATDVGSVRELADFEGGIVVPPHDASKIASGILAALKRDKTKARVELPTWGESAESLRLALVAACDAHRGQSPQR